MQRHGHAPAAEPTEITPHVLVVQPGRYTVPNPVQPSTLRVLLQIALVEARTLPWTCLCCLIDH